MLSFLRTPLTALRDEPRMRSYLTASFVDDVGVAVSAWATQLLMVHLFTSQRERARLMLPSMLCFLLGTLVAGPLADWVRDSIPHLARYRWRLVVWARLIETAALALLIQGVRGRPTIAGVLPYVMVSAFMKTALRPTRIAFQVDLLQREAPQLDAHGAPLLDERGAPRAYKVHLLTFDAMSSFLRSAATFGGLLLGGKILAAVAGRYVPLFAFDVLTNLGFIAIVYRSCHPSHAPGAVGLRDLVRDDTPSATLHSRAARVGVSIVGEGLRELRASFAEVFRFLRQAPQRPLLLLLFSAFLIEVVSEFYDGKMIVLQVLHGTDETVRHVEILWSAATLGVLALLPMLARQVASLGRMLLVAMFVDGLVMVAAGVVAGRGAVSAVLPFALLLAADKGLTATSGALASLAQNSASSAALRGRIAAVFAFVVIVGDLGAEVASTAMSEAVGIAGMVARLGAGQIVAMGVVAAVGGKALWDFGLRSAGAGEGSPLRARSNSV